MFDWMCAVYGSAALPLETSLHYTLVSSGVRAVCSILCVVMDSCVCERDLTKTHQHTDSFEGSWSRNFNMCVVSITVVLSSEFHLVTALQTTDYCLQHQYLDEQADVLHFWISYCAKESRNQWGWAAQTLIHIPLQLGSLWHVCLFQQHWTTWKRKRPTW